MPGKGSGEGSKRTTFKPGVSGNPGGLPKRTQVEIDALALAKTYTIDAVNALRSIAMDRGAAAAARVTAAEAILNRVYGKPKEVSESTVRHERRSDLDIIAELESEGFAINGGVGRQPSMAAEAGKVH
jgi:hypothetical protein